MIIPSALSDMFSIALYILTPFFFKRARYIALSYLLRANLSNFHTMIALKRLLSLSLIIFWNDGLLSDVPVFASSIYSFIISKPWFSAYLLQSLNCPVIDSSRCPDEENRAYITAGISSFILFPF